MPKFRKKPVVIEAVQFDGQNDPPGVFRREEDLSPYVITVHGQRCYIAAGDWIIPEPDGVHHYPCKPDIFAATYEPVSLIPCDACRGDAPDPGIAARERSAIGQPPKGACCAWSRVQLGLPAQVSAATESP